MSAADRLYLDFLLATGGQPGEGTVYLLCFNEPIGSSNPRGRARHYIGWARCAPARIATHTTGNSHAAAIVREVQRRGIGFQIAGRWQDDRRLERRLKRRHDTPGICPICRGGPG
jgi:hypothetical protein